MRLYGGLKTDKACLLIALDQMFPNGYEGRDFLLDMFQEHFQDVGIGTKYLHIIEECAPVLLLPNADWDVAYNQGDTYVSISHYTQPLRYRVHANAKMIYMYEMTNNQGHAICIPASLLTYFLNTTVYANMFLPRPIIRDNVQYKGAK